MLSSISWRHCLCVSMVLYTKAYISEYEMILFRISNNLSRNLTAICMLLMQFNNDKYVSDLRPFGYTLPNVYTFAVMYTLMLHGKRIWMPKRRWWRHFQHTTYFRILYILLSILSSHFIFLHFNFAKWLIQYVNIYIYVCVYMYMYVYVYIGKHGKDNCDVTKYSMI